MPHELNGLLADVGKGGLFQVVDHVRRHVEDAGDFRAGQLAGVEELGVFRRDGQRLVVQVGRQQQSLVFRLPQPVGRLLPGVFQALPRRVRQRRTLAGDQSRRPPATFKELPAVAHGRHAQADGFGMLPNRTDADPAFRAEGADVHHVLGRHRQGAVVGIQGRVDPAGAVLHQAGFLRQVHFNALQLATTRAHQAAVTIAPTHDVALLGFPPLVGGVPGVRLDTQQVVRWVIGARLDAVFGLAQHHQRQLGHRAGYHVDTGVHRRQFQRRFRVDHHALAGTHPLGKLRA
ncbi:hypothetical protein D3C76_920050 [compost metagenome]